MQCFLLITNLFLDAKCLQHLREGLCECLTRVRLGHLDNIEQEAQWSTFVSQVYPEGDQRLMIR